MTRSKGEKTVKTGDVTPETPCRSCGRPSGRGFLGEAPSCPDCARRGVASLQSSVLEEALKMEVSDA